MPHGSERLGHAAGTVEFHAVPLAVIHAERVRLEAVAAGDGQGGSAIQAAADQNDGSFRQRVGLS